MSRKQYKKSEASKRAILDAAYKLIMSKGYEKTSIKDIVKESGLPVGSVYHHFRSKDDMLNEAFLMFDDQLTDGALAALDNQNALDAIKGVLLEQTIYTESIGMNLMSEYYRALLQNMSRDAVDPQRRYYQAVETYVKKALVMGLLKEEYSSTDITDYLIRNVRGILVDWCLHNGQYSPTEKVKAELDFFLLPFLAGREPESHVEGAVEGAVAGAAVDAVEGTIRGAVEAPPEATS